MSLSEPSYLLFLGVAAVLVWGWHMIAAGKRPVGLLVLLGLVFYSTWNVLYCIPLLITAATDFSIALAIDGAAGKTKRRLLVSVSLLVDLGMLAFFKYLGLFGIRSLPFNGLPFKVAMIAGISFYTFQ